jgi:hypothetical protein
VGNTLRIGTDEVYEDADDLDVQELREVKRVTGMTLTAFWAGVRESDPDALAALVWTLRRRTDSNLRMSDVHFRYSDLAFDGGQEDETGKAPTSTTPTPPDGSASSLSTPDGPASSTTG